MQILLPRIKRHLAELLGADKMSSSFHFLTINYTFLMVYFTLESVFVNTLIYRVSGDMLDVIKYRAVTHVLNALSMTIGAHISRKRSPITTIKIGGISYLLMYVVLFFGMEHMASLKTIVAIFSGAGAGFYWTGQNILVTHYTTKQNRATGLAIQGIVQGIMTLLVPVISGFVISLMPGNTGYRVMFGVGMLAVILQRFFQGKLTDVVQKTRTSEYRLALKLVWRKMTCKLMLSYEIIRGFREGTFAFFLNMVLFEIITDEGLVGINTFFTGIMAIIGAWAYGKFDASERRVRLFLASTTVLMLMLVVLYWWTNAFTVILFSIVNAIAALFVLYIFNTYSYNVMGQNEIMRQCMGEMCGLRELAINIGRLLGLYTVTLFPQTLKGYVYAMMVLVLSQYPGAFLIKLTRDILDRKDRVRIEQNAM